MFISNDLRSERGTAMILTMGVLVIMVVMALEYATIMKLEEKAAFNYLETVNAGFSADAGIAVAIGMLWENEGAGIDFQTFTYNESEGITYQNMTYDWFGEDWSRGHNSNSEDPVLFDISVDMGSAYDLDSGESILLQDLRLGELNHGIEDEQAKINIITTRQAPLKALMDAVVRVRELDAETYAGAIQEMTLMLGRTSTPSDPDAVYVDTWGMTGPKVLDPNNGWQPFMIWDKFYTVRAILGQMVLDAPLEEQEAQSDLSRLIATDLFDDLKPFLTLENEQVVNMGANDAGEYLSMYRFLGMASSVVNINTARPMVLYSVFQPVLKNENLSEELVEFVIAYRRGDDRILGTSDDDPFDGFYVARNNEGDHPYHFDLTEASRNPFGRHLPNFPSGDGFDTNGDGVDNIADRNLYIGGARGEFELFLDALENMGVLSSAEKHNLQANMSHDHLRDINKDGQILGHNEGGFNDEQNNSIPICFSSNTYTIISEGRRTNETGQETAKVVHRQTIQIQRN